MKIGFQGHASISLHTSDGLLIQDPWYHGKVFNNSWGLISPPNVPNWSAVTMIWISHEHPDHLNFPTLKSITPDLRKGITILYQRHASPRVVDSIRKLGFKGVVELSLNRWIKLKSGTELYCGSVGSMDSFLAVRDGGVTVLNLNDCVLNLAHAKRVASSLGDVDFIFSQFSFANWVGNDSDETSGALSKLDEFKRLNLTFRPKCLIPSASFVYFCNAENERMNAWANHPAVVSKLALENVRFMYPGDVFEGKEGISKDMSNRALQRYEFDLQQISIDPSPESIPLERLQQCVQSRLEEFGNTRFAAKTPTLEIFVKDLNVNLICNFKEKKLEITSPSGRKPRFEMVSQVVDYCFRHSFGPSTIYISGMYKDLGSKEIHPFFRYQNWLSTELINPKSIKSWPRMAEFFWKKRSEVIGRVVGRLHR